MKMTTCAGARRAEARGVTAVEFAIIIPVFFTVVFALFEFGHYLILRDTATEAAREAARTAMAWGGTTSDAKAKANAVLATIGAENAAVTFSPATITDGTTQVTVDVAIPFSDNSVFLPPIFIENATIRGTCTLACEGYRAANGLYGRPPLPPPGPNPGQGTWNPRFSE